MKNSQQRSHTHTRARNNKTRIATFLPHLYRGAARGAHLITSRFGATNKARRKRRSKTQRLEFASAPAEFQISSSRARACAQHTYTGARGNFPQRRLITLALGAPREPVFQLFPLCASARNNKEALGRDWPGCAAPRVFIALWITAPRMPPSRFAFARCAGSSRPLPLLSATRSGWNISFPVTGDSGVFFFLRIRYRAVSGDETSCRGELSGEFVRVRGREGIKERDEGSSGWWNVRNVDERNCNVWSPLPALELAKIAGMLKVFN